MRNKNTAKPKHNGTQLKHIPFYLHKLFLWPVGIVLGLIIATFLAFQLSPWPSAMLVRHVFTSNDKSVLDALQKHTPTTPVTVIADQQYKSGDKNAFLDIYTPTSAVQSGQKLPVIIWTHGGAWVSGDKSDTGPYYKLLAAEGFTVVSLNYTRAPEKKYPAQIFELNEAHAYIRSNSARLHIDPNKIFFAGDSAGSQLSAQMATIITNPAYAKDLGITPTLKPSQLAGAILFCGIYKMEGLTEANPNLPKLVNWGDDQVMWAFSGSRNKSGPLIYQMSPYYHVTKDFPATFVSGGNGDPLTDKQSVPLANKLQGLGVSVTSLFYPSNHQPSLPHEYQFNLDTADGQQALARLLKFLEQIFPR